MTTASLFKASTVGSSPAARPARVLAISGTDPSGGAGSLADIKSITAAGGYAMHVTTAVVAQNTQGVRRILQLEPAMIREQLAAVSDDVTIDAVKIGMLGDVATIEVVREFLEQQQLAQVVLDPVMVATSGDRLLATAAETALRELLPLVDVVTPNLPELALLCEAPEPKDDAAALELATSLAARCNVAVVMKRGHFDTGDAGNALVTATTVDNVPSARIATLSTHGTGCSLSAALATRLGAGESPLAALSWSTRWLHEAINYGDALGVGHGHGPVDHSHQLRRLALAGTALPWPEYHFRAGDDLPSPPDASLGVAASTLGEMAHVDDDPAALHMPPVGSFTAELGRLAQPYLAAILRNPFVVALATGSLNQQDFLTYIAQDAVYLGQYARVLAAIGGKSADAADAAAWIADAHGTHVAELAVHETYLGSEADLPAPSGVTAAYTNFLTATAAHSDYCVAAAAVLPCYWLYLEVGLRMLPHDHENHPYHAWLSEYGSPEFRTATQAALERVERAFAAASPATRAAAIQAFLVACRHEYEFFDQALRTGLEISKR
ncbi:bifunctional hydroxymethylpyrimidine kinase/phosphomethylpyrimidine kinase [Corynebacterium choanae]|uniref:Thiamine biosynthesis multifunctional protein ThiED n=1 Tax=Corynebacterium choanae TaxID=1862358 RepID=A0A3G6J6F5_9CORY|nr:bifunctional hydroxymethylpyrimidine kinase/phosphomethylpyrimidine kinase [Corynebacterium choanae]AZA13519.1 Hydroxymethylpyrimidine/phosphomethylpyrimidine kinase [Corynebacterium choanae]